MAKLTAKEFRSFQMRWQEYEDMVRRILPRFIARRLYDLSDDLDHALYCRDRMEEDFARYADDPRLTPYRLQVVTLDADLLLMRAEVLARYPLKHYRATRKRNAIPRTHWWWYLDEAEEEAETKAAGTKPTR